MSRTYRKYPFYGWRCEDDTTEWFVAENEIIWEDVDEVKIVNRYSSWASRDYYDVIYKPDSPTGRRMIARKYRDRTIRFKEPGPSWFRNMFEERPLRRASKRELQRYMANEEYEPMVDARSRKRIYWT